MRNFVRKAGGPIHFLGKRVGEIEVEIEINKSEEKKEKKEKKEPDA